MAAPERFAERSDSFPLHRGRRPYMALRCQSALMRYIWSWPNRTFASRLRTQVIDLAGGTGIPGLIDSHTEGDGLRPQLQGRFAIKPIALGPLIRPWAELSARVVARQRCDLVRYGAVPSTCVLAGPAVLFRLRAVAEHLGA
jgi:hypothetical protein